MSKNITRENNSQKTIAYFVVKYKNICLEFLFSFVEEREKMDKIHRNLFVDCEQQKEKEEEEEEEEEERRKKGGRRKKEEIRR